MEHAGGVRKKEAVVPMSAEQELEKQIKEWERLADFPVTVFPPVSGQHKATIVFMHGLGDQTPFFERITKRQQGEAATPEQCADEPKKKDDFFFAHVKFVLPKSQVWPITKDAGEKQRAWYNVVGGKECPSRLMEQGEHLDESVAFIHAVLAREAAAAPRVPLFLVGFSQGGTMANMAGFTYTHSPLAGVINLSGYVMAQERYIPRFKKAFADADAPAAVPRYLNVQGAKDGVVIPEWSSESFEILESVFFPRSGTAQHEEEERSKRQERRVFERQVLPELDHDVTDDVFDVVESFAEQRVKELDGKNE